MIDCSWWCLPQEKKLTDSCVEMPSSPSLWPVMPHAQRTVCSACGLRGPPAHTPARGKPQKGNRYEHDLFWPMPVMKVRLATNFTRDLDSFQKLACPPHPFFFVFPGWGDALQKSSGDLLPESQKSRKFNIC